MTIALGSVWDSARVGTALAARGFLFAWESSYLRTRNWFQVALVGEVTRPGVKALPRALRQVLDAWNESFPLLGSRRTGATSNLHYR